MISSGFGNYATMNHCCCYWIECCMKMTAGSGGFPNVCSAGSLHFCLVQFKWKLLVLVLVVVEILVFVQRRMVLVKFYVVYAYVVLIERWRWTVLTKSILIDMDTIVRPSTVRRSITGSGRLASLSVSKILVLAQLISDEFAGLESVF